MNSTREPLLHLKVAITSLANTSLKGLPLNFTSNIKQI